MTYNANIYNVMLASPSDVTDELKIAREVIFEWNNVNSFSRKIVLHPINWEYSSYSSFNDKPQEVINQQLLKNADILIGIFWTRIGTPTGKAISGTVEEIDEHIKSGKPTMLFFSNRSIYPDRIDRDQYDAVLQIKKEYQKNGLTYTYNSSDDFRSQFQRQISLLINSSEYFQAPEDSMYDPGYTSQVEENQSLSPEAKILLIEGAEDPNGQIMKLKMSGGLVIQANRKTINTERNPRSDAKWISAFEELVSNDLLRAIGYKEEIYSLTKKGFEIADILKSETRE